MRSHSRTIHSALRLFPLFALALLLAGAAQARPSPMAQFDQRDLLRELAELQQQVKALQAKTGNGKKDRELRSELEGIGSRLSRLERSVRTSRQIVVDQRPPSHVVVGGRVMDAASFAGLRRSLAASHFGSEKLTVISTASRNNWFDVSQVRVLLDGFAHASERLQALRLLWPRVVDRGNGFLLYEAFPFQSDRRAAQQILES
jgi:hypothetical protein